MNRFEYTESRQLPNETYLRRDSPVRLYDGDVKTNFEAGELILTNYRILWTKNADRPTCLSLPLSRIIFYEEESPGAFSFGRSKKVVLHLAEPGNEKLPGPIDNSTNNYLKLSFKEGLDPSFIIDLANAVASKEWERFLKNPLNPETNSSNSAEGAKNLPTIKTRRGIVGIERSLQEKHKATDESISMAFQDLKRLMAMAKDMVTISKTISAKIRERAGDISEDETVKFKSYLMSMGIDDPVTRDAYKSSNEYYRQLAMQLSHILEEPIKDVGGMMALTDVYCRVNRARGMELLSPEDLLNASRLLSSLDLPIVLRIFDSGVMVIQARSHDDNAVVEAITEWLKDRGSATAEELAQSEGISVLLARERLFVTEKYGGACRDDTIEALRFYPNRFLEETA